VPGNVLISFSVGSKEPVRKTALAVGWLRRSLDQSVFIGMSCM